MLAVEEVEAAITTVTDHGAGNREPVPIALFTWWEIP